MNENHDDIELASEEFHHRDRQNQTADKEAFLKKSTNSNTVSVVPGTSRPNNVTMYSPNGRSSSRFNKNWNKFRLVLWKNYLLQWRHKKQMIFEIIIPVLLLSMLLLTRISYPTEHIPDTLFEPFTIDKLDPRSFNPAGYKLVYMPESPTYAELVKDVSKSLGLVDPQGVINSTEMIRMIAGSDILAGIVFHSDANVVELPKNLSYSLRFPSELRTGVSEKHPEKFNWFTNLIYPPHNQIESRAKDRDGNLFPNYEREGFLAIQNAIARAYIRQFSKDEMPKIQLQRYPYPAYNKSGKIDSVAIILPVLIFICFVYFVINTVRFIALEKEKQLKEAMKIMGLPNWLHWAGWFVKSMSYLLIVISLMVFILKTTLFTDLGESVLKYSDWSVLWAFFLCYSIATVSFCFMLSVFFSKANTAATVCGIAWTLSFVAYLLTRERYDYLSAPIKLLVCLLSNSAMGYGIKIIMRLEVAGDGIHWSNLWHSATSDDALSVGLTMVFQLLDSILYFLIALYIEKVFPGEFGVPEHWYFPFTKSFWCDSPEYKVIDNSYEHLDDKHNVNLEPDPSNRQAGIQVRNLRKEYGNKKVAVKGLTINMFDDQITVLLGHNGAGKTTTMSMLTGMFPPSSGTALINGCDIRTNISGARDSLGLCPQHNILFDELTVSEHIQFFARLKGLESDAVDDEIKKYVQLLELEDKANELSETLSGGMKRKLSVAIAFCGHSKVVLCDEPSSGLDPSARRFLWDLLQKEKIGRTVLLSTHFMDEADVLGDRIAIMAEGELKCCGSSFFLKKRYGTGYQLVCVKDDNCRSSAVTELLRRHIPDIELENEVGTELTYELPEDKVQIFQIMLADLEQNSEKLGLSSYGVSLTTLEDVFLKVGVDSSTFDGLSNQKSTNGQQNNSHQLLHANNAEAGSERPQVYLKGIRLMANQWLAMFKKRFNYTRRNLLPFLIQALLPIGLIAFLTSGEDTVVYDLPPLAMSVQSYKKPVTILEGHGVSSDLLTRIGEQYNSHSGLDVVKTSLNMMKFYLDSARTDHLKMEKYYLFGATINDTITAWFNSIPFHSIPMSLSLVHNAIVRAAVGADRSIYVINEPVPFTPEARQAMLASSTGMGVLQGLTVIITICFAMVYVSAYYVMFYIRERKCKLKLLQFVSGVDVFTFWNSALLWDLLTFAITILITVLALMIVKIDGFSKPEELARIFLLLLCFGFAVMPLTYLFSLIFSAPSSGYNILQYFNVISGLVLALAVFIVESTVETQWIKDIVSSSAKLSPHYLLFKALYTLWILSTEQITCDHFCPIFSNLCCKVDFFDWKTGISEYLVYMLVTGVILMILLFAVECGVFHTLIYGALRLCRRDLASEIGDEIIDDDVLEEKHRLNGMQPTEISSHNLVMRHLSKFYGSFLAVNQISVAVEENECFGLLGTNGAGKTSIFKMLVGDTRISSGDAFVRGTNLKKNMRKVHQEIGYCPQFDATLNDLTGRETLEIFCLLRGIPTAEVEDVLMGLAKELQFDKHLDKLISAYSGGNKRKLSTALALVGDPEVIYLDEPTTGMDPGAKRHLWSIVSKIRSLGKSIVLTSHSMEECEALCTRLAIMVNGEFKCLGSTQHLKNKFSKGYSLKIKTKQTAENDLSSSQNDAENIRSVKEYIGINFPGASLKEDFQGLLTYYVPPSDAMKWSSMFGLMETAKRSIDIEDYSISQTSLEQVFLSLTKQQKEEMKDRKKSLSLITWLRSQCKRN